MRALRGHVGGGEGERGGGGGGVSCLCVCSSYNVVVSGGADGGVIVWDLNQNNFGFLRRLRDGKGGRERGEGGKGGGIVGVSMNHLEGDIAACSGDEIWIWSINGHPYVRKKLRKGGERGEGERRGVEKGRGGGGVGAGKGGKGGSFSPITALLMSNQEAWTGHNFCITGHEDGSIKVNISRFFDLLSFIFNLFLGVENDMDHR